MSLTQGFNMQFGSTAQSGKTVWEKHLVQLIPFIPKYISRGASVWTSRLLWVWLATWILIFYFIESYWLDILIYYKCSKDAILTYNLQPMQAFTHTFKESKPSSLLKLACLSAMEDMLTSVS